MRTAEIVRRTNDLVSASGTHDPARIADLLGITVLQRPFRVQKGAYKIILRNRFIWVREDLHPVMKSIVIAHELGHDLCHQAEAAHGGFREFNLFDMQSNRLEYEANVAAAQIMLPDDEFLEYCERGFDIHGIARAMNSDINLVALKSDTLIAAGYRLRPQTHDSRFLK